jgi:SpoVK/Ycf46/Vps4 family AAA+-type ATPase
VASTPEGVAALRGRALEPEATRFGLEPPRGVLLTGVPGCGKSLVAKSLARSWGLPLVLLDPARLFGPYVGESERRLHASLRTVEAMAPVVLWIDEIEKGFPSGGEADAGVARRVLGSFLRWMQDRPPGVFVVATSNDVTALPPEFARKGRFDEVFFVDLPAEEERREIFRLHLTRRDRDPDAFDVSALAGATEGFSGAEIEAAVVGALYRAYAAGTDLTNAALLEEVAATLPLSRSRPEEIALLRGWAEAHAIAA